MTEHTEEREPVRIPRRPSKRRRAGNRLIHADGSARAPARPEPERDAQHDYATVDGARVPTLQGARLAVVGFIAGYMMREPPSLSQLWAQHRHAADVWRPKPAVPAARSDRTAEPQMAWDGEAWAQVPAPSVPAVPASPGRMWICRARLAWGAFHTGLTALIYLALWVIDSPLRTLIAAALVWILLWTGVI